MFIVLAFALAGVPVWRLTRPAAAALAVVNIGNANVDGDDAPAAKPSPLDVEAVFAPAPTDFEIRHLDRTVLTGRGPQARFTTRWTAAVPVEGVDLVVQARWSEAVASGDAAPASAPPGANSPAAARITVRFVDGRLVEKSFWAAANGALAEVLTVPGAPEVATTP